MTPAYPLQFTTKFPYYGLVPKDWRSNLRFRERVLTLAEDSAEHRADLWEMARRDFLFFLNVFGWVNEPRNAPGYREMPFITRAMQDKAFAEMLDVAGVEDAAVYKSREVGASWGALCKAAHDFLFVGETNVGVVSATEDLVDKTGDNSSLFAKIDYFLDERRFPWWLLPQGPRFTDGKRFKRNKLLFENPENQSSIVGYACTGEVGRGGRKAYWIIDELASFPFGQDQAAMDALVGNTNSRIMISTPKLPSGVFYDAVRSAGTSRIKLIEMDWKDDPEKAAGLYTSEKGRLKVIDRDFWAKVYNCAAADVERRAEEQGAVYPFVKDGEVRSVYFDWMLTRPSVNAKTVARELNRRFEGSGGAFFTLSVWQALREKHATPPVLRGRFGVDPDTLDVSWHPDASGPVKLWVGLAIGDKPGTVKVPVGRKYVSTADVAAGTAGDYSSNSVNYVFDAVTGEQVLAYATNSLRPDLFAKWNVAICQLFNNAFHIWDAKGTTGSQYTGEVLRLGYQNVYRHVTREIGTTRRTKKPGIHVQGKEAKAHLLRQLEVSAESERIIVRDEAFYDELSQYVWKGDEIVHATSVTTDDDSASGTAHGDRVMGAALVVPAMTDRPEKEPEPESGPAPYGSLAWRMQQAEEREAASVLAQWDWND